MIKKNKIVLIIIAVCLFISAFFLRCRSKTQEDFYNESVAEVLAEAYNGIVVSKYYDKFNHGTNKVIISNNGDEKELNFVYEKPDLYNFIKIEDTLIKEKNLLFLQIKRKNLDTVIELKFENIKGIERFGNEQDH